jgi:cytoskeletal protein CcmA (bactofilin family)
VERQLRRNARREGEYNGLRMTTFGKTLCLRGELRSAEDLQIDGRIEGPLSCEGVAVTISAAADVTGEIVARDITVFGRTSGRLIATEVVDLRPEANVSGTVIALRFILDPQAAFSGRVEPQHLEAAVRIARYEQRKRDAQA